MKKIALIISCEHAVNTIPNRYKNLFKPYEGLLNTHRGIDFGALDVALHFKQVFACDLIQATTSRLLIDCNRSLHNRCFSEITKILSKKEKQEIVTQYYLPYRSLIKERIEKQLAKGVSVVHCSVHSFTPVLNNIIRNADIAFLYDPQRHLEKKISKEWKFALTNIEPEYKIRMNYPYKGKSDGVATSMRKKYNADEYVGIEIELNQSLTQNYNSLISLKEALSVSLSTFINKLP